MSQPIARLDLPGIKKFKSGKVREVFSMDGNLLLVATDRISAFDYILPTLIPRKGEILTRLSAFWFRLTKDIVENHFITDDVNEYPQELRRYGDALRGRSMLVRKTETIPVECVVRGYISGSAWKEYEKSHTVCGEKFSGLEQCGKFSQPIFTPATKADSGHDENISFTRMAEIIGKNDSEYLMEKSIRLYNFAHDYALQRGIIIADTKFEFGRLDNRLILIDEIFTPDSSRFWEASLHKPGTDQPSYDKQFVRNYLLSVNWDRNSPPPELPPDIVNKTLERYAEALKRLADITV
jgi:phosphoribosylaminoimidazole-succinocarboxamide synthase